MVTHFAEALAFSKPAAQDLVTLRQVFEAIDEKSCPYQFNFHMHTVHSDGQLQPESLMEQAIAIGLQGLAITDHHQVSGYLAAQQWLDTWKRDHCQAEQSAPHLWTGVEITAQLLYTEVHILGYGFDPAHAAIAPYLQGCAPHGKAAQAEGVITSLHQAGGFAVLAHPVRYRRSAEDLITTAATLGIDGIEAYYAYNNPNPWQPSFQETEQVKQLGQQFNLLTTCGTDTHGRNLLMRI
ncbi:MAG: PHP domain-containing protein [Scytolyngbya sp. HA4215-MV1]|jgi:hypothetical protein|nr:PHP domain-containing protein [Scytolyngbya sp. HA4215-MV1]